MFCQVPVFSDHSEYPFCQQKNVYDKNENDNNQNTDFPDTEKYQIISKVEYIVPAIGDFVALIKKDLG